MQLTAPSRTLHAFLRPNTPAPLCDCPPQQMTYVKQLEAYEEAVMKKRIEEMTEAELQELASEVESDRQRKAAARLQQQKQQQQQQ